MILDHVLLDVIAAFRQSLDGALLERQAVEERFQADVLLGDISWETSYSLPGEGARPRVRADLSIDWPTWSQSSYRSWSIGEPGEELPELVVEVALRIQCLREPPDLGLVMRCLPQNGPSLGTGVLEQSGITVEQLFDRSQSPVQSAVEVSYEGTWQIEEPLMEDPSKLVDLTNPLGRWVASTLVRLGDLDLGYLPAEEGDGPS